MIKLLYKLFPVQFNTLAFHSQEKPEKLHDYKFIFIDRHGRKYFEPNDLQKMSIERYGELIKYLGELEHLRTPPYNNNDLERWKNKIDVIVEEAFSKNSDEYGYLHPSGMRVTSFPMFPTEEEKQKEKQRYYLSELSQYETGIQKILDKHEILGVESKPNVIEVLPESIFREVPPKAFISHGKESSALRKLKEFIETLGIEPLIVKKQASLDKDLPDKVNLYLSQADFVIILATGDDEFEGKRHPRQNVIHEIGLAQKMHPGRIIYLLEQGAEFPSNIRSKVWESFKQRNMMGAFLGIVRELRAYGILKVTKFPIEEQKS